MTLVVLIQNPKGGGIDSSFGAANQLGSVQKTTDVIEKATWYLAGFILVISLVSTFLVKGNQSTTIAAEESKFDSGYAQQNVGVMPTVAPVQPTEGAPTQE